MHRTIALLSLILLLTIAIKSEASANTPFTNCSYETIPSDIYHVQPGYQFQHRRWLMKGNGLTPSDDYINIEFTHPEILNNFEWNCVRAFLRDVNGNIQYLSTTGISIGEFLAHSISVKISPNLKSSGNYHILLAANEQTKTFASLEIKITEPLYIVISTDWDYPSFLYPDITSILTTMDGFRKIEANGTTVGDRPGFTYSHFVGPYIWGYPSLVPAGSQYAPSPQLGSVSERIENWLKHNGQDEIGVHFHGWLSSLLMNVPWSEHQASNLDRSPTGWDPANSSGYAIEFRDYSLAEQKSILNYSSQVLVSRGFNQPRSFRAGGWAGSNGTLLSLSQANSYELDPATGLVRISGQPGYLVDSSSTWPEPICIKEGTQGNLCNSLASDQSSLSLFTTPASQPYRDFNSGILEVPDNGTAVDYVNFGSSAYPITVRSLLESYYVDPDQPNPMPEKRVFQFMFHPHSLLPYASVMKTALEDIDSVLYALDRGPAVYIRISDLTMVYP